ncbi:MAG: alpha/beta hydrolase [Candidatus Kapaibacterium sp.]
MEITDGRYFSNGEKNLYIRETGYEDPQVIIDTALGGLSVEWWNIQKELSEFCTVITYDRAGYGESPAGSLPRTSKKIAEELRASLMNSGNPGPYILIGHSAGGLNMINFASLYPEEVIGLVLVDSITARDNEFDNLDAPNYQKIASLGTRMNNLKKLVALEKDEFEEKVVPLVYNIYADFPEEMKRAMITYQTEKKLYKTVLDEYIAREENFRIISSLNNFPEVPVKVLCRDHNEMIKLSAQMGIPESEARVVEELWLSLSRSLTDLSPKSEFILVAGSDHNMHVSRPDVIVSEVKSMVEDWNKKL